MLGSSAGQLSPIHTATSGKPRHAFPGSSGSSDVVHLEHSLLDASPAQSPRRLEARQDGDQVGRAGSLHPPQLAWDAAARKTR